MVLRGTSCHVCLEQAISPPPSFAPNPPPALGLFFSEDHTTFKLDYSGQPVQTFEEADYSAITLWATIVSCLPRVCSSEKYAHILAE